MQDNSTERNEPEWPIKLVFRIVVGGEAELLEVHIENRRELDRLAFLVDCVRMSLDAPE